MEKYKIAGTDGLPDIEVRKEYWTTIDGYGNAQRNSHYKIKEVYGQERVRLMPMDATHDEAMYIAKCYQELWK